MTDPIAEAAREVEEEHAGGAPGEADPDRGAEADPDPGADEMELPDSPEEIEQEPATVMGRLMEPMESDPLGDHLREMWDPERGGLNRLVGVAKEVAGVEESLPRIAHVPIALAEAYHEHAEHLTLGADDGENDEESSELQIDESAL